MIISDQRYMYYEDDMMRDGYDKDISNAFYDTFYTCCSFYNTRTVSVIYV